MLGKFNWKINFRYQKIKKGEYFTYLFGEKLEPKLATINGFWGYPLEAIEPSVKLPVRDKDHHFQDDMRRG